MVVQAVVGRVTRFVQWHKKKVLALGAACAIGIGGYYYAKRMLLDGMRQFEELGRGLQEKMLEGQHRQSELRRIRDECARIITTFVPPLRSTVKQLTDPKPVTEKLKAVRQRQKGGPPATPEDELMVKALWEDLKVVSLTRLLASVYALGLLNAVLRVQLHVLGRYSFEEGAEQRRKASEAAAEAGGAAAEGGASPSARALAQLDDEDDLNDDDDDDGPGLHAASRITRKVRERFLFSGSDHLMNSGNGMRALVARVEAAIRTASAPWLMGTNATVNRQEVLEMLAAIRTAVEAPEAPGAASTLRLSASARDWVLSCLVPEDEADMLSEDRELDEEQNKLVRQMLEETLDMLESPLFAVVLEQTFDALFDALNRDVQSHPFEAFSPAGGQETSEEAFLLTKVIVSLKLVAGQILTDAPTDAPAIGENSFERALSSIPALDDLCTAIFQQGAESGGGEGSGLDGLDLGELKALGLGDEDLEAFASLLGLGGAGSGGEAELMQMLTKGEDPSGAAGTGGPNEADMMRMLQTLVQQQGQAAPS